MTDNQALALAGLIGASDRLMRSPLLEAAKLGDEEVASINDVIIATKAARRQLDLHNRVKRTVEAARKRAQVT